MFRKKFLVILRRIITGILFLLSVVVQYFIFKFIFFDLGSLPYMSFISSILSVICAIYIAQSDGNQSFKISWILVVLIFPFAGTMFFLLFGRGNTLPTRKYNKITKYIENNIHENASEMSNLKNKDDKSYKIARLLKNQTDFPIYENTKSEFFNDGALMFNQLIIDLESAKEFIFLEFFIISKGHMWDIIKEILIKKASMGVEVKIIYDAIGSARYLTGKEVKYMNEFPNIEMVPYSPMGMSISFTLNYRDHRKIVVIDGKIAYTGGINIADEYIHLKDRFGYFRDNGMKISGEAVYSYTLLFIQNWYMSTKVGLDVNRYSRSYKEENDGFVLPFGDGPTNKNNPAYSLFLSVFDNATDYVYLSTPYFIIDKEFINNICIACKSGVDVRILVPHIPDKKLVFTLTRAHFGDILKAGGKIYEYTPGFNHAKNIISDDKLGFVGTINTDYRSLLLHFECGNLLIGNECLKKIKDDFLESLKVSEEITLEKWNKRPFYIKLLEFVMGIFGPLL